MVIKPTRLYKTKADVSLEWIYAKLAVKKVEFTKISFEDKDFQLGSMIKYVEWHSDRKAFEGRLSYETLRTVERLDGTVEPVVDTEHVDFLFTIGSSIFIAYSRKDKAETAATRIMQWVGPPVYLSNCTFSPDVIERFLEENDHTIKRCYWKNLVIPGINRANLDGPNVGPTEDAQRYDELGDKNYITIVLHDEHLTVTISSSGAVGFISKIDRAGMLDFLKRKIFPMITY